MIKAPSSDEIVELLRVSATPLSITGICNIWGGPDAVKSESCQRLTRRRVYSLVKFRFVELIEPDSSIRQVQLFKVVE